MNNNLIIRYMKLEDIDGVYNVEKSCFPDPWSKESFKKEVQNKLAKYLVAQIEDKVVAYVGAWFVVDEAHITNVAVSPQYRGQKIGDKIVKSLIDECQENKIKAMTLEVRVSNIVAQNLYKKYGFKLAGVRKEYYSDNKEDALIMWKHL
ncbi:MAG TPA: ribosomal protein S18-alanine N-acetyltransferase [Peptostreptococcaceae bacterium]|nr:ribosomal protein S18-alanine N-acetyltransferase [Peptostreptococcaceae bacterium]